MDSRLRGNDGSFSKVSLMGEESKTRVKTMQRIVTRHCGLDPQSRGVVTGRGTRHSSRLSPSSFPRRRESTGWGYLSESGFAGLWDLRD